MGNVRIVRRFLAIAMIAIKVSADSNTEASKSQKLLRERRSDDSGPLETVLMQQAAQLSSLQATVEALQSQVNSLTNNKGSTYVSWGRSRCPSRATTVYTGYAGGGSSTDTGAGANRLCLTSDPVHDDTTLISGAHGTVYGAQYYYSGRTLTDVLCALCHTSFFTTFMIPGTDRCPNGATEQYKGYLSSGNFLSAAASEYLCLDSNPEDRPGTTADQVSAWFEHTSSVCGSLPCPPYVDGKAVTCVVCSK